jgi:hypothetical protein
VKESKKIRLTFEILSFDCPEEYDSKWDESRGRDLMGRSL